MTRLLAALALAVSFVAPAAAYEPPSPGGICTDPIDFGCRPRPCGVDELDCGMIVCFVWVAGACVIGT